MASLPTRLVSELLARTLSHLASGKTMKLSLDTGSRLDRIELVTDPPYCKMVSFVTPGATEVRFEDMPACVVESVDYYDQNGICFMKMRIPRYVSAGDTVTVPLFVSVW